jgi:tellurite resistance protein TehA-like permease
VVAVILLLYAIVFLLEFFPVYKKRKKKELVLYTFLFLAAATLSILLVLDVNIPSPAAAIGKLVKGITGTGAGG